MTGGWMALLREIVGGLRALLGRWLAPAPPGRRSILVLVLALAVIPAWQKHFLNPEIPIPATHAVYASTGVHSEPKFFFFLYHLGLYPLRTAAPILADTKAEAERQLRENGKDLLVDEGVTFRSGDRGRVYLYYPDAWINHRTIAPKLGSANGIAFSVALMALFAGFWWIQRPAMGAIIVLLIGSDPFQLYVTYRQENVFGWAITTALLMMAMHLPIMTRSPPRTRWLWALPIVAGFVLASARTVRGEGSLMAISAVLTYLTLAGAGWRKRVGMAAVFLTTVFLSSAGYTRYFQYKFQTTHATMVQAGGTPYTGPLQIYHEVWHPIFCGLGDFDTKYGYQWDDRVGYAHAYPILVEKYGMKLPPWQPGWYTFNATYDGTGKYPIFFGETPHYNDIIRDKVLGDIRRDPLWYLDILKKRAMRVLSETPPLTAHVSREPVNMTSPLFGFLCVPLALFLALSGRWTQLKCLLFSLPLTAPALLIYSDKGMTNYSTYHYFGFAILCSMLAEGARAALKRNRDS